MSYAEYAASAPVGVLELRCLEISHAEFEAPLRIYTPGYEDLAVTLETGATAVFKPVAFRTSMPTPDESGRISRSLEIDAVDGSLRRVLLAASQSDAPILASFRIYLSSDLSGPQFDPPEVLSLSRISLSKRRISARAENEDVINRRFPAAIYTTQNTPGLRR